VDGVLEFCVRRGWPDPEFVELDGPDIEVDAVALDDLEAAAEGVWRPWAVDCPDLTVERELGR